MVQYKIYLGRNIGTEGETVSDKWFNIFLDAVSSDFPGFTVSHNLGYWEGKAEPSAVIEILTSEEVYQETLIQFLCKLYKTTFQQDSVLYTKTPVEATFI